MRVDEFQWRLERVCSRNALVAECQSLFPGESRVLRQMQLDIPAEGKTYIATCTATAESFEKCRPVFESVLASFQAPTPVAPGINWPGVGRTTAIGGLAGALVGLLIGVGRRVFNKGKPQAEPPTEEQR
ncbi:MAG: hypothetical protein NZ700_16655 [Gemmataceae bacterium]|nr:hypothetical protein [Gemmataceae bacterium]MDW8264595.1 hypothetical protein [Gemmataceae bacterium]